MTKQIFMCLILNAALASFTACEKEKFAARGGPAPLAAAALKKDAPAEVTPGLHEDWCDEHQAPESMCARCNPALIPTFKTKGDWCEEHGLPESQCRLCNPELRIERPAADISTDDGPVDGTKVRLATSGAVRAAGLRVVPAVEASSSRMLTATARITYDATRLAVVNARAPGVVDRIIADVGAAVLRGSPLAVIQSAEMGAEQSRLEAARTRVEVAEANHARARSLHADGILPEKDLLAARQELEAARAEIASSQAALTMVGTASAGNGLYTLTSPLSGVVLRRNVTQGQLVAADATLFEIVDPSKMWAEIDIAEQDLLRVRVGQSVVVRVDLDGGREFSGEIVYIAPEVDPRTRTAKARVPLENPEGLLRAHMFAEARIHVPREGGSDAVLVPFDAVQRARSVEVVFVRLADDVFEARRVRRGAREGDLVAVTGNLRPGEQVVTEGSFLLKTETLKDSIGAGCVDDH